MYYLVCSAVHLNILCRTVNMRHSSPFHHNLCYELLGSKLSSWITFITVRMKLILSWLYLYPSVPGALEIGIKTVAQMNATPRRIQKSHYIFIKIACCDMIK